MYNILKEEEEEEEEGSHPICNIYHIYNYITMSLTEVISNRIALPIMM